MLLKFILDYICGSHFFSVSSMHCIFPYFFSSFLKKKNLHLFPQCTAFFKLKPELWKILLHRLLDFGSKIICTNQKKCRNKKNYSGNFLDHNKKNAFETLKKIRKQVKIKRQNRFLCFFFYCFTKGFVLSTSHFLPKSVIMSGPTFWKTSEWYVFNQFISISVKSETSINFFWIGIWVSFSNPRNPNRKT